MNATKEKYTIFSVSNYDKKIRLDREVYYGYSEKALKKRYPEDNYTVVGEVKCGKDKKKIGELPNGEAVSKYDTYSRVFNRKKGYLCVGQDSYILVLRPRIPIWFLFFLGALLLALLIALLIQPQAQTVLNPDAPLPDISPIEDDQSVKPEVDEGDGSVTMIWTLAAEADLSEGKVEVYFKNPNASTHDVEVELYVISGGEEVLIARSDRVKAGYALNRMDILRSVTLSEGLYTGLYRVIGYDPKTGEEAAYLPQIPDVLITAKY